MCPYIRTHVCVDVVDASACVCMHVRMCVCNIDDVDFVYILMLADASRYFSCICAIFTCLVFGSVLLILSAAELLSASSQGECSRFTRSNSFVCTTNRLYPSRSSPDDFTNTSLKWSCNTYRIALAVCERTKSRDWFLLLSEYTDRCVFLSQCCGSMMCAIVIWILLYLIR